MPGYPAVVQILRRWLNSETYVLFTLTVVVGCLGGLAAVGFHQPIDVLNSWLLDPLLARPLQQRLMLIPLLLITVGLIVGLLLDKVVPFARLSILGGKPSLLVPEYSLGNWHELFA